MIFGTLDFFEKVMTPGNIKLIENDIVSVFTGTILFIKLMVC